MSIVLFGLLVTIVMTSFQYEDNACNNLNICQKFNFFQYFVSIEKKRTIYWRFEYLLPFLSFPIFCIPLKRKCPYLISVTFNITLQKGQIELGHLYLGDSTLVKNFIAAMLMGDNIEFVGRIIWLWTDFLKQRGGGWLEGTTWQKLNKSLKHERKFPFHMKAQFQLISWLFRTKHSNKSNQSQIQGWWTIESRIRTKTNRILGEKILTM